MASFLDNQPTQFNPYIQQVPVEEYAKIGMAKQAQYDEGVNKVRQYYQSIAGLDVDPKYKEYLGSAVNNLQTELKKITSADFSDAQLVNSVGSLAGNIGKDPILQAGVYSYANKKKQLDFIEKQRQEGKGSPSNEYFFGLQYQKWSQDQDLSNPFTGQYTPYRDYKKKILDIAKEVGIEEHLVQNLFNPDGSVNKVMVEKVTKGKDPNKLYMALSNGLDASDVQQMQIDGIYQYRNVAAKDLIPTIQISNKQFIKSNSDRKLEYLSQIDILKKQLSKVKGEEADQINKQIEEYELAVSNIDTRLEQNEKNYTTTISNLLSETPDDDFVNGVKGNLYTENFMTNMSQALAPQSTYIKYDKNPLWEAIMKEKEFAMDSWYKREQIRLKEEENRVAKIQAGLILPPQDAPYSGNEIDTESEVRTQLDNSVMERSDIYRKIGADALGNDPKKIQDLARQQGKSVEDFLEYWGSFITMGNKHFGVPVSPEKKKLYGRLAELNKFIGTTKPIIEKIDAEFDPKINLSNIKPLVVSGKYKGQERTYNFDPQTASLISEYIQVAAMPWNRNSSEALRLKDQIKQKMGIKDDDEFKRMAKVAATKDWTTTLANSLYPNKQSGNFIGRWLGNTLNIQGIDNTFGQARVAVTAPEVEQYKKLKKEAFANAFPGYTPKSSIIPITKDNKNVLISKITQIANNKGFGETIKPLVDTEDATIEIVTMPSITGSGETKYGFKITATTGTGDKKTGASSQIVPMSTNDYIYLTGQQPMQVNPVFTGLAAKINIDKTTNTNPKNPSPQTAMFDQTKYFPNVKNYTISADIVADETGDGTYFLKIYPLGKQPITIDHNFTSLESVYNTLYTITDNDLKLKIK